MGTSTRSVRGPSARRPRSPTDRAPLGAPLFVLNLKAYPGCVGPGALRLGRALARLSARAGVDAAIAPSAPDLSVLATRLPIPVLAQHADPFEAGARTGFVVPETLLDVGVRGSLVNHSEHRLDFDRVGETAEHLRSLGLVSVVCGKDVNDSRRLARFRPPYLAVEPPELIGGTRSVSKARPAVISGTVSAVRDVSPKSLVLCGAGVHDRDDVRRALELGSHGVLVSSAVARAKDPAGAITELLAGFG